MLSPTELHLKPSCDQLRITHLRRCWDLLTPVERREVVSRHLAVCRAEALAIEGFSPRVAKSRAAAAELLPAQQLADWCEAARIWNVPRGWLAERRILELMLDYEDIGRARLAEASA